MLVNYVILKPKDVLVDIYICDDVFIPKKYYEKIPLKSSLRWPTIFWNVQYNGTFKLASIIHPPHLYVSAGIQSLLLYACDSSRNIMSAQSTVHHGS